MKYYLVFTFILLASFFFSGDLTLRGFVIITALHGIAFIALIIFYLYEIFK